VIPFPRLHFVVPTFVSGTSAAPPNSPSTKSAAAVVRSFTSGSLCSVRPDVGRRLASVVCCRGISQMAAVQELAELRRQGGGRYADFSAAGVLVGTYGGGRRQDEGEASNDVAAMHNSCEVGSLIEGWTNAYEAAAKGGHTPGGGAGLGRLLDDYGIDKGVVDECCEEVAAIARDYAEIAVGREGIPDWENTDYAIACADEAAKEAAAQEVADEEAPDN